MYMKHMFANHIGRNLTRDDFVQVDRICSVGPFTEDVTLQMAAKIGEEEDSRGDTVYETLSISE